MTALKRKIKQKFNRIPLDMVKSAIRNMRKRAALMVEVQGRQFEGKKM